MACPLPRRPQCAPRPIASSRPRSLHAIDRTDAQATACGLVALSRRNAKPSVACDSTRGWCARARLRSSRDPCLSRRARAVRHFSSAMRVLALVGGWAARRAFAWRGLALNHCVRIDTVSTASIEGSEGCHAAHAPGLLPSRRRRALGTCVSRHNEVRSS